MSHDVIDRLRLHVTPERRDPFGGLGDDAIELAAAAQRSQERAVATGI